MRRATEAEKLAMPKWVHSLGGGMGATVGALITSPLEVVKTRLQAKANKGALGVNLRTSFTNVYSQEGLRGFYRGLSPQLAGVVPARSLHFLVYGYAKDRFTKSFGSDSQYLVPMSAAGCAGATVVTTTQPLWFIKTRLQLQVSAVKETLYTGPIDVVRRTLKEEGIQGMYRGLGASYLGLAETMIQFTIYEHLKKKFDKNHDLGPLGFFSISSVSKLIASVLTYPHEVIRTRLREQKGKGAARKYKGPIHGLMLLGKEEGRRGLYGGLNAHLVRVVPNAAILLMFYEGTLAYFAKKEFEED